MSPPETSSQAGLLEHPIEALTYYRKRKVETVICEQKHMGSRVVAVICRDAQSARQRFGVDDTTAGVLYTRTGRRFFDDKTLEEATLAQIRMALERSGFWQEFQTDWVCLDCELMPWSVKAQELIQAQYATVGAAAQTSLITTIKTLDQTSMRGLPVERLSQLFHSRLDMVDKYVEAYQRYCWSVQSIADLRLAPFHILATEGAVHKDKSHLWHMQTIASFIQTSPGSILYTTPYRLVKLEDEQNTADAVAWWEELTAAGGEGMVVKPLDFVARERYKLLQPAIKCRGSEYLRIIYGPEYDTPEHLKELRQRSVSLKRKLALQEFALGIEALERFVLREPLRNIHKYVFGVLALESEPVDPRL